MSDVIVKNPLVDALMNQVVEVNMTTCPDVYVMIQNNINYEQKKPLSSRRSDEMIADHTLRGYGAELALCDLFDGFNSSAPIIENREGISYKDLNVDLTFDGKKYQVKTKSHDKYFWTFGESQYRSIMKSMVFNDYYIVVDVQPLGGMVYRYVPFCISDSKTITDYFVIDRVLKKTTIYRYDHDLASENGKATLLWTGE